jgi:hypothetical protein
LEPFLSFPLPSKENGNSILVVYDSPDEARKIQPDAVYADVFRLRSINA